MLCDSMHACAHLYARVYACSCVSAFLILREPICMRVCVEGYLSVKHIGHIVCCCPGSVYSSSDWRLHRTTSKTIWFHQPQHVEERRQQNKELLRMNQVSEKEQTKSQLQFICIDISEDFHMPTLDWKQKQLLK